MGRPKRIANTQDPVMIRFDRELLRRLNAFVSERKNQAARRGDVSLSGEIQRAVREMLDRETARTTTKKIGSLLDVSRIISSPPAAVEEELRYILERGDQRSAATARALIHMLRGLIADAEEKLSDDPEADQASNQNTSDVEPENHTS